MMTRIDNKSNCIIIVCTFVAVLLGCASCSTKEMTYVSDAERDSAQSILSSYSSVIHPGDELYIQVTSQTPEAAEPFNSKEHKFYKAENRENVIGWKNAPTTISEVYKNAKIGDLGGYLVTEEGLITFPILGDIFVVGLTQDSVAHMIERKLIKERYLNDPIVTVSPLNFRVTVVGEVTIPKELHVTGNRLTIFEALAMCGDITLYGQRNHVSVVRDIYGMSKIIDVDLTQKTVFDSEAYYLQSNDVIYVEPNKVKKHQSVRNENSIQRVTFWVAVSSMVLNLYRVYLNSTY